MDPDTDHAANTAAKFSSFDITTTPYKIVHDQEIPLWVMIPKNTTPGPRPILVHFHGGFLATGHALFADWTTQWSLDYITRHNAIMVRANYRLIPESNGLDILSDVEDLWNWVEKNLASYLVSIGASVSPDLRKIITYGESAGGYLAIQSGLLRRDLVKAVIAAYPMTYMEDEWYSKPGTHKTPFGAPQLPISILDQHVASTPPNKIVTGAYPPDRVHLGLIILQQGLKSKYVGTDDSILPSKVLAKAEKEGEVPFLYVLHGRKDSAVPAEHSVRYVKAWKEKFGEGKAVDRYGEEGEHGFDAEAGVDDKWMAEGLKGVCKAWGV